MKPNYCRREGNVLLITMALLTVVCGFAGLTFSITSSNAKNTDRSRDFVAAQAAAEGAVEFAYAIWTKRIGRGQFTTDDFQASLVAPQFPGIVYADGDGGGLAIDALDAYGVPTTTGVEVTGRVPGYEGWSGRTRTYSARARVKLDDGTVIGVRRLFQYTEVPLFQSMFFFQHDLEFYRPATMMINGLIHSNSKMYMSTDPNSLTLQGNVTYTDAYLEMDSPAAKAWTDGYKTNWKGSPPIWDVGKDAQLHQVPAIQPMGGRPDEVFDDTDSNPNNDGYRELIEPPDPNHDDPVAISDRRLINKAGIVIEINDTSSEPIKITGKGDTTLPPATITKIKAAIEKVQGAPQHTITTVTGTNRWGQPTTTTTTVPEAGIRDRRENQWVDVATLDVGLLKTALSDSDVIFNNVIYIHDTTPAVGDDDQAKTIRLKNGSVLPDNGLTIASENPIYIQGDYNTGGKENDVPSNKNGNPNNTDSPTTTDYDRKPAAVIADAVMLLSNAWSDSKSDLTVSNRVASNTTYNTAILSGFMPSVVSQDGTAISYSGGANNFPRFLENWSGKYCTYFGSMVELFESKTFTGKWNTGDIYSPPNRCWNFDTKFLHKPPPGSVEAIVLSRGPWSRF